MNTSRIYKQGKLINDRHTLHALWLNRSSHKLSGPDLIISQAIAHNGLKSSWCACFSSMSSDVGHWGWWQLAKWYPSCKWFTVWFQVSSPLFTAHFLGLHGDMCSRVKHPTGQSYLIFSHSMQCIQGSILMLRFSSQPDSIAIFFSPFFCFYVTLTNFWRCLYLVKSSWHSASVGVIKDWNCAATDSWLSSWMYLNAWLSAM